MAILTLDSLTGCTEIRDFIGGENDTPANPSKMIFYQTSAPTSWVKETTHNDKSLRVIGGSNGVALSPGGSIPFTTLFTNPFSGSYQSSTETVTYSVETTDVSITTDQYLSSSTSGSTTLQVGQLPVHIHDLQRSSGSPVQGSTGAETKTLTVLSPPGGRTTGQAVGASSHNHSYTVSHGHGGSIPHNHTSSGTGPHSHSITSSQNFSVYYVDVIIAKKS